MSKTSTAIEIFRPVALGLGIFGATAAIGAAQVANPCATNTTTTPAGTTTTTTVNTPYGPQTWTTFDPAYNNVTSWQPTWDTGGFDRNHVMVGTVTKYAKSRLTLQNGAGDTDVVDLKEGTVILPTGGTPTAGQRAAVFGYWSNGTFIANRVVLHG
ncbi:MAG TPA: hypothetical protein VHS78_00170 [Candidatus Elarobacter sp.]|jgi:hypothetical protein|nr:hypothetical protein [Candidatus Elarobacter sp.]